MSTQTTAPHESGESSSEEPSALIRTKETVKSYARNGSIAFLIGGTLLVWAIRNSRRSPDRAVLQALGATALFGIGLRQRRSTGSDSRGDGARERGDDSDEEDGAADPRRNDDLAEGDAEAEVDISEAAIAAEPAEAAGLSSEQAQPTSIKDRPTPMGAESGRQFNQDDGSNANVGADEGENEASGGRATGNVDEETSENGAEEGVEGEDRDEIETQGGASIHTETIEAGTMDIDEGEATDPDDSESDSKDDETDEDRGADDKTG